MEEAKSDGPEKSQQPAGTVERVLNFRDRNLLIGACREFCQKEGKGDHKAQAKLDRVMKLLSFEETVEYYDMMNDWLEEEMFKWQRLRNDWMAWQGYRSGSISLEEMKAKAPTVDIAYPPNKPPRRQPELSPGEVRGKPRPFYFPPKLDVWAQECLKGASWNPLLAENVTELCGKFGIKGDEE